MNDTCSLLHGKLWAQHEGFYVESVEEKFETVGLDQIICENQEFSVNHPQLFEHKSHNELVSIVLAHDIVLVDVLEGRGWSLLLVDLDHQGSIALVLGVSHEGLFNLKVVLFAYIVLMRRI